MKKTLSVLLAVICACGLIGCHSASVSEAIVDRGESALYTERERDAAIKIVKNVIKGWGEGFELHRIAYSSDAECNEKNLTWLNEIAKARGLDGDFTQCLMLKTDFHTPKTESGSFNPDDEYHDYEWWLARTGSGDWQLITGGYC